MSDNGEPQPPKGAIVDFLKVLVYLPFENVSTFFFTIALFLVGHFIIAGIIVALIIFLQIVFSIASIFVVAFTNNSQNMYTPGAASSPDYWVCWRISWVLVVIFYMKYVIDEYSYIRTRKEQEYLARKEQIERERAHAKDMAEAAAAEAERRRLEEAERQRMAPILRRQQLEARLAHDFAVFRLANDWDGTADPSLLQAEFRAHVARSGQYSAADLAFLAEGAAAQLRALIPPA